MGNCAGIESQESVVYLMQKGDNAKVISMFVEFQDTFKAGYAVNSFGDTALHYAAALGNLDIVRWLCTHGAEVNTLNMHGWTAADAAKFNEHQAVVKYLQSAGGVMNYFKPSSQD